MMERLDQTPVHSAPQVIRREDYTPPDFRVDRIDLHVDIREGETIVTSTLSVIGRPECDKYAPLVLDGQNQELIYLKIDGEDVPPCKYTVGEERMTIEEVGERATVEIRTRIHPEANTALEGLYRSGSMYCTQCEPEGFRRITYFVDRPDNMALFTTTIEADKDACPVLLSNGNPVGAGDLPGGRHWAKWEDPFRKPAYLFALVAGNLVPVTDKFVTASGRTVDLRIYVEQGNEDKCAHAMDSLKRSMRWDEAVFGLEYDLDIFMIVAVGDFNMGAMENKGLNIFNAKYVLAKPDTATDSDYQLIEGIIAHEYFHNWTGNRVTCRDWFQLSLKEGLTVFRDQEFSADMNARSVKRIQDVRALRAAQFPEDAGPMAHPVRPDSYIEINNFYTATVYEKGAEVVRMYHTLLGAEGFRKGMDLYFQRHDGDAVTCEDFCLAMEAANGADLSQFRRWYEQAGTPQVKASGRYDAAARTYTLTIEQSTAPTPGQPDKQPLLLPMAMGLVGKRSKADLPLQLDGENAVHGTERVLRVTEARQIFTFVDVDEEPVPSLFRGFSAPVKLDAGHDEDDLAFLMAHDSDEFNRWEAGQALARKLLLGMVDERAAGREMDVPDSFVAAFRRVLTDGEAAPAFRAQALALPSEGDIGEAMRTIDVDGIHAAREHLRRYLAGKLKSELRATYEAMAVPGVQLDGEAIGKRALRNLCLGYLAGLDADGLALAAAQFDAAEVMTDSVAALVCLADSTDAAGDRALAAFHQRWRHDPLVMDKWFAIQAMARRPDTLARVKALMGDPSFSVKNPNKVRSLLGAFAAGNPVRFHAADGSGYRFIADQVIALDPMNPQVAARLFSPFARWRRFDDGRQALLKAEIERVLATPKLSKDVYEVASKSVA
ncbi:MAG: aminopeptidase N [Oceanibaculum nanhaiense]|uniref:aminopeptidase N n=1 Tax=Oceanibaculum nanhaiense TaxID=1909734 RepID=UPI0025A4BFD3|nr:aminopeptidase N [Oceanibaculum nanhaiense]MDM7947443.1 aminopeptidase N [Oceanibaculum nanhaiense]